MQAKDLPEDLRVRLMKELAFELGVQPPTIQRVQEAEVIEKPRPKKITITLEVLAKYPILPELSKFLSGIRMREVPSEVFERAFESVVETLERGEVKSVSNNCYIEVLSYPPGNACNRRTQKSLSSRNYIKKTRKGKLK